MAPPRLARCRIVRLEPRVGGSYLVAMTMSDGRDVEISGSYKVIERPSRLVLTWTGNYNYQETLITVTFREEGDVTLMTLRQEGFIESEIRDGYESGWTGTGGSFDKLAARLKG